LKTARFTQRAGETTSDSSPDANPPFAQVRGAPVLIPPP
jgi:hypothetical protein